MAIVDSLLQLVTVRGADALVMPPGEVPFLEKRGDATRLSMPVPGKDIVDAILKDVLAPEQRTRLPVDTVYRGRDASFDVRVEALGGGYHFTFRLRAEEQPAPPPAPVATPTASPYRVPSGNPGALEAVLLRANELDASDVLVSSGEPPRLRVGGELRALEMPPSEEADLLALIEPVMGELAKQDLRELGSCDVALAACGRRYRVNLFKKHGGLAAALRPVGREVPTLAGLHLPDDLHQLTRFRSGLVLVVGTAGSGKSTTLVALIEQLNRSAAKHVITLEDPIEYTYAPAQALIHQREVGRDVKCFASGLRAALRESPDVILVGEMRDHDTIAAALTAAETGHLVLSTLHSGSADMAIHRIVDTYQEHEQEQVRLQLADVLRAVVTQRLLPSTRPPLRVPVFERLNVNTAVATKIRENRCHQIATEVQRGRAEGMVTFELSLSQQFKRGLIARSVALEMADDPTLFEQLCR
jgi:twitching motility protein PilT